MTASIRAVLGTLAATLLLVGCNSSPSSTSSAPEPTAASQSTSAASDTAGSGANGLIKAVHSNCDFGDVMLRYLASGDNQGNPNLDTSLSQYVGVPVPQARGIADRYVQDCDARLSKQEAEQASAAASVQAEASRAAAEAQAVAQAAKDKATLLVVEQKACAPLGGT